MAASPGFHAMHTMRLTDLHGDASGVSSPMDFDMIFGS